MRKLILVSLTILLLSACNVFVVHRTSYVQGYTEYGSAIVLEKAADGSINASVRRNGRSATINSSGADKDWFNALCNKYGDVSYPNKQGIGMYGQYAFIPQCITPDLVSIDVKANIDFDADHPAGSSLADIMRIRLTSFYDFVRAGYKNEDNGFKDRALSELTSEDLMMLEFVENIFILSFNSSVLVPETPFMLTVSCQDADGRHLSGSVMYQD